MSTNLLLKSACDQFDKLLAAESTKLAITLDLANAGVKGKEIGKGLVEGIGEGVMDIGHRVAAAGQSGTDALKEKAIAAMQSPYALPVAAAAGIGLGAYGASKLMKKKSPSQTVNIITR